MRGKDITRMVFLGGVVLLSLVLLLRVLPMLRFFLLLLVGLSFVGIMVYYFRQNWESRQSRKAYLKSTAGQIGQHLQSCQMQQEKLKQELADIQDSLIHLNEKLREHNNLPAGVVQKTNKLIKGFEQEKQIRISKQQFFRQCASKLQSLLTQHELLLTLEAKAQELERYQEQHYDDLASMETLRYEVEQEAVNLETIQDLSTRMQGTSVIDDVLHLQQELDKMLAA